MRLTWCGSGLASCANSTICLLAGSNNGKSGSYTVSNLPVSTRFHLLCGGLGGLTEDYITVHVAAEKEEKEEVNEEEDETLLKKTPAKKDLIKPETEAPIPIEGCLAGYFFNIYTGAPCRAYIVNAGITSASYAFGTTLVKIGTRGEACKVWQSFFNDKAYARLKIDGICGPLTMAVARSWQATQGLKPDGLLGPLSRARAQSVK